MAKDREKMETMSLELYLQFFESHKQIDLTVRLLNEIILMRGGVTKKVLINAIYTINLIDPARSTVEKHTSLPQTAKLEDVIEDLKNLTWQECCVTSIQTLNSLKDQLPDDAVSAKIAQRTVMKVTLPKKTLRFGYDADEGASASCSSAIAVKHKRAGPCGGYHAPCMC